MTTKENTSRAPVGDVIDRVFDIQAIALSAAALAGSEMGGGCPAERAMLTVGAMLGQLATQIETAKLEGGV